eukprot:GHUV01033627.1.p1 GENE.GHUV01033627.1~~GHUV01033627.1.p1  ORF type:complete len:203 (+),score=62.03 GHUV01033627.1:122-730(+)
MALLTKQPMGCGSGVARAPRRAGCVVRCAAATEQSVLKVSRNENFGKLQAGYLFPEIARRRRAHQEKHPDAQIISLGIGDTTEPLPQYIADAMAKAAAGLATREGYSGYGAEQGQGPLREAIAKTFYSGLVSADEVFVSDGSKCDIARLQVSRQLSAVSTLLAASGLALEKPSAGPVGLGAVCSSAEQQRHPTGPDCGTSGH